MHLECYSNVYLILCTINLCVYVERKINLWAFSAGCYKIFPESNMFDSGKIFFNGWKKAVERPGVRGLDTLKYSTIFIFFVRIIYLSGRVIKVTFTRKRGTDGVNRLFKGYYRGFAEDPSPGRIYRTFIQTREMNWVMTCQTN